METNLTELLKHLPAAISSIDTPLQLVGLVVIAIMVILVVLHKAIPSGWIGPLAMVSVAGLFALVGLVLLPTANQISQEAPTQASDSAPARALGPVEILPASSTRRLTDADIAGLGSATLRIARNEIFARKQRFFRSEDLQQHFAQFPWYEPNTWEPSMTDIETANVAFLRAAETAK